MRIWVVTTVTIVDKEPLAPMSAYAFKDDALNNARQIIEHENKEWKKLFHYDTLNAYPNLEWYESLKLHNYCIIPALDLKCDLTPLEVQLPEIL